MAIIGVIGGLLGIKCFLHICPEINIEFQLVDYIVSMIFRSTV